MSAEIHAIMKIDAAEEAKKIATRIGESRIDAVLEAITKHPAKATSARRLARHLGIARWHVEAAFVVLHERGRINFIKGCAITSL